MLTYFRAVVIGLLQGVTELFPISSLGHSVFIPALLGWTDISRSQSASESPYLAFLVGLHVATAIALLIYFRRDWDRIIRGLLRSTKNRRIDGPDERLGWLLIVATIPTGITGLLFEHTLRTIFAKPLAASLFLMVNGLILLAGERVRRRAAERATEGARTADSDPGPHRQLGTLEFREAGAVGIAQIAALFAGVSRSGVTMVAGLAGGLDHEDAARFSFLLATPIILAACLQTSRPTRTTRQRHPRPSAGRQHRCGPRRIRRRALPGPLLRNPDTHALRGLQPRRGRDPHHPLRVFLMTAPLELGKDAN